MLFQSYNFMFSFPYYAPQCIIATVVKGHNHATVVKGHKGQGHSDDR